MSVNSKTQYSIAQLEKMLSKRRSKVIKLERQRASLLKHLESLESHIASLGGSSRLKHTRAKNETNLNDAIAAVLKKSTEPVKVSKIVQGVLTNGYVTTSPNFRGIVNQALIKDKRFVKGDVRGTYLMKSH